MKTTYYNHNDFQTSRARDLQLQAQLHAIGDCIFVQGNLFMEGNTACLTFQEEEFRHQAVIDSGIKGLAMWMCWPGYIWNW